MEEFLKKIGITQSGKYRDDSYIVKLRNFDEYGRIYSLFDRNPDLYEIEDQATISEDSTKVVFSDIDDKYILELTADFDSNIYELTIK